MIAYIESYAACLERPSLISWVLLYAPVVAARLHTVENTNFFATHQARDGDFEPFVVLALCHSR